MACRTAKRRGKGAHGRLEELIALARSLGLEEDAEGGGGLPFKVITLRDEQDLRERWLLGRAAIFYPEASLLAINVSYGPLNKLVSELQREFSSLGVHGPNQGSLRSLVENRFVARIGRTLLYVLAKKFEPWAWSRRHIASASSEEALTLAADDLFEVQAEVRAEIAEKLK